MNAPGQRKRTDAAGRAFAGSQLQVQLYVDGYREVLDSEIRAATGLVGDLTWLSPVRKRGFKEYKDAQFLEVLGLGHLAKDLAKFWPASGPRWDGLASTSGRDQESVILVEAKNYPREVRGGGCKASNVNDARNRIQRALRAAGSELGVGSTEHWMGPLYQYANRLAHVQFLRRHGVAAYLVNLCFYDDPKLSRRTSESTWRSAAVSLKLEVGFDGESPSWLSDVFLPAKDGREFLASAI